MRVTQLAAILGASFFLLSNAQAATTYADANFGSDANECKKSSPCQSIQRAIDLGGNSARVIVAPGQYLEDLLIVSDGVRLQSQSGQAATSILGQSDRIIEVLADRFTLGGKGKGFSILAIPPVNVQPTGVYISGDRAKIEYNEISTLIDSSGTNSDAAIRIDGSTATIRHNEVIGFENGFNGSNLDKTNYQITDNSFSFHAGGCIVTSTQTSRSRDKIRDNKIEFCNGDDGLQDGINMFFPAGDDDSKPDIRDNRISSADSGIRVNNSRPSIRNNFVELSITGINLNDTTGASVRDNHIDTGDFIETSTGISIKAISGRTTTISGNNLLNIDNPLDIDLDKEDAPFSTISKNVFGGFDCPVMLDIDTPGSTIKFSGNYWGFDGFPGEDGPVFALEPIDGSCAGTDFAAAVDNGLVTFSRSADNPLTSRYKTPD